MTAGPRKPVYRFGLPGRVKGRTRWWGYAAMAAAKMRREMAYPISEDGVFRVIVDGDGGCGGGEFF